MRSPRKANPKRQSHFASLMYWCSVSERWDQRSPLRFSLSFADMSSDVYYPELVVDASGGRGPP
eukprot:2102631-Amphidinium_carterae.1